MTTIEEKIKKLENQIGSLKKEAQKEEGMEQWFKSVLNGLQIEIDDNKPNSVFYKKNGKIFFELYQDTEEKYLWVDYDLVWSVFNHKYILNHAEAQEFITNMVKQHLKLEAVIPWWCSYEQGSLIE
jgi:hypothetical protein